MRRFGSKIESVAQSLTPDQLHTANMDNVLTQKQAAGGKSGPEADRSLKEYFYFWPVAPVP